MERSQPDNEWDSTVAQNRRAWEEIADTRAANYPDSNVPAEFFKEGGSILDDRVVDAAGDVSGLRVLHLMCSTGEESLSWANLGARVVGVDFSASSVTAAREKARKAEVDVEFVEADVGRLPPQLADNSFDLVYTATGVMVWIPDLDVWAEAVAAALRPDGRFVMWEEHPLLYSLSLEKGRLRVTDDYFSRGEPQVSTGWTHFAGGDDALEEKREFIWPLGDIVNALAVHGLLIERLDEYPTESDWRLDPGNEDAKKLPGLVLLVARKV